MRARAEREGLSTREVARQALATVPWMPTYRGADGALLHHDVLGESSTSPPIVLAGGAARHPQYLGDLAGLSERTNWSSTPARRTPFPCS